MRKLMLAAFAAVGLAAGVAQVAHAATYGNLANHGQSASPGWSNGWNQNEQAGS